MILQQSNGYGRRKLRRVMWTAPAALLLVLAACGSSEPAATPTVQAPALTATGVTVETGGMALPAAATSAALPVQSPSPVPTQPPTHQPGAVLTATGTVVLTAEPDHAALGLAEYAPGSRFTVIEPDSDDTAYPVEAAGQHWYRVRAEDGLVGWMAAE